MKTFIFHMLFVSISLSQVFSPDILIDTTVTNQYMRSTPAIDLNSKQDLGIAWSIETLNEAVVEFTKSYDSGNTFDTVRTVDSDPYPPWYMWDDNVPVLKFDYYDNPLILYLTSDWVGTSSEARIKKSNNGGQSFSTPPFEINTTPYRLLFDYLSINDTLGLLAYLINSQEIKILESLDGGITFNNLSMINCNHSVNYKITLVKCGNDDILCFWTGSNTPASSQVYYVRSNDNGRTFSNIQPVITSYQHANGISAYSYQNYIFVTYFAADSTGRYIAFQKSDDNGFTFLPPIQLIGESQPLSHPYPEIRFNPNVCLGIIWGQWYPIYFTYSTDMGNTFDTTQTLPHSWDRFRYYNSMAISDSGDVYVASLIYLNGPFDYLVLNKLKLPVLTLITTAYKSYPTQYILNQNYPNPFNSSTHISFYIPQRSIIQIKIYDINGRLVKEVLSKALGQGNHKAVWDGTNQRRALVTSGIYICQLKSNNITLHKKIIFVK